MSDDIAELRQLAGKPWRGACTECRDRLWFADTEDEAARLVREHLETHLRVWAHSAPPQPAEPQQQQQGELSCTSASTQIAAPRRDWRRPAVTARTPFGFTAVTPQPADPATGSGEEAS